MDVEQDRYWPWLGFALDEALKRGLTDPAELIGFANPDVLVAQLPRELTTQLVAAALAAGTLTPTSILESVPPAVLAEHLESEVLWRCLVQAADKASLDVRDATVSETARSWLEVILARGLADGLVTPADVVQFVTPAEFVKDAPLAVVAELIRSGLSNGKFNPDVVLQHLTPSVIAHKLQPSLGWACIADAVKRRFALGEATAPQRLEELHAALPRPPKHDPKHDPKNDKRTPPPPRQPSKSSPSLDAAKIDPVLSSRAKSTGWSDGIAEDTGVEVLEDAPLPPPPVIRQR
jgi:hypothetical protein